jgi:succinate-semialdehyde dehydrogenase/glutarate-semialdehyde dehydrogenase
MPVRADLRDRRNRGTPIGAGPRRGPEYLRMGRVIRVVSPATGEEIAAYPEHTAEQIDNALGAAHTAQRSWRRIPFAERRDLMLGAATLLRSRRTDFALLAATEMGKPLAEAEAEVDKCALTCDFYAENAQQFLADELVETEAQESFVIFEPIGVVVAIMPWNFPFWQVVRFAAPALMAGNGALLKHSPNVSGCALAIERLFLDAGFPPGLFATLLVSDANTPAVTERLIADPRVAAVTLTGSERAGAAVGAAAGRALKPTVLELGGSDPFVVLNDADLAAVAAMATRSRFLNGGQSCIAAKRFVVDVSVADEFERLLVTAVEALPVGDPTDPSTRIGPMARADLVDGIDRQVRESVAAGARVLLGGAPLDRPGSFYAPTILTDVTTDMPVFTEETFGPVAAVIRARRRARRRARERHWLRARGERLDSRHSARPPARTPDPVRRTVRQRRRQFRPAAALRRHETQRTRPGARRIRHPGLHQCSYSLGRSRRRDHPANLVSRVTAARRGRLAALDGSASRRHRRPYDQRQSGHRPDSEFLGKSRRDRRWAWHVRLGQHRSRSPMPRGYSWQLARDRRRRCGESHLALDNRGTAAWSSSSYCSSSSVASPLLFYRHDLPMRRRVQMMLLTATALPLLVALAEIGLESGTMLPENAAALVGAGVPSIIVFPAVAVGLGHSGARPLVETPGARRQLTAITALWA